MLWAVSLAVSLFPDERRLLRHPLFYVGLVMCLAGFVAFVLLPGGTRFEVTGTGIVVMFFCSLFFGLYSISIRHHLQGVPPILAFGVVSQFVSVGTVSAMLALGEPSDVCRIDSRDWLLLMASSLLGIALGHFFLYTAIQRLGAAITTGAQSATPFVTAALAFWFLGEKMTQWQWLAGVTIVLGAAILISNERVIRGVSLGSRDR
jgi:drug/metabolite transporter (DMT)-like permease